jgi:hypothetical protein
MLAENRPDVDSIAATRWLSGGVFCGNSAFLGHVALDWPLGLPKNV